MKKLFSIIMSTLMIACFMPGLAFAETSTSCSGTSCDHEAAITAGDTTTHYDTLKKAVEAAANGQTVTLLKDIEMDQSNLEEVKATLNQNIILDGSNHTIKATGKGTEYSSGPIYITSKAGATVKNLRFEDLKNIGKQAAAIYIQDGCGSTDAPIRIENCSFTGDQSNTNNAGQSIGISSDGRTTNKCLVVENCNFTNLKYGMYMNGFSDMTVKNCIFNGTLYNAINCAATAQTETSENILINNTKMSNISFENYGDDLYSSAINVGPYASNVTIKGCSVLVLNDKKAVNVVEGARNVKVEEGEYSTDPSAYVAEGFTSKKDTTSANWIVTGSAKVDELEYGALSEAIEAAGAGKTIELLSNVTLTEKLTINKDVTIEGQGKIIAGNANSTDVYIEVKDGELTMKDLTLTDFGKSVTPSQSGVGVIKVPYDATKGTKVNLSNVTIRDFHRAALDIRSGAFTLDNCTIDCKNETDGSLTKGILAGLATNKVTGLVSNSKITSSASSATGWTSGAIEVKFNADVEVENSTIDNCQTAFLVTAKWRGEQDTDPEEGPMDAKLTVKSGSYKASSRVLRADARDANGATYNTTDTVNINVQGGTFTAESEGLVFKKNGTEELTNISITGGTFSVDPSDYLASSRYYTTKNADGTYGVRYASSSGGSAAPTTDNVTNKTEDKGANAAATTTATVKNTTTTASDGTKTVAATVDTTTATKIVEKAVENKSEEVVVNAATAATVSETAAGTKTEVAIPAAAVSQVAEKTDASVTIKSDAAEVTLDKEAVAAVAEAAGTTGEVKLVVDTVAQEEGKVEVDLKLVTANGNVSEFKGGKVSVTIKLGAKLAAKDVKCLYIDDAKAYHKVDGQKNADGTFTFKTGHFSSYAVVEAEEADKLIAEQDTKVAGLTKALTLKARSAKTAKGNIKVTLTADKDAIKAIEDLGYTVKYKFYRSTKKAASYKAKLEGTGKTYTNTTGKKGTKYYYKARVMVYDAEGTLIAKSELKQCRYACRTR